MKVSGGENGTLLPVVIVRFEPLVHGHAGHARIARPEIVIETRFVDIALGEYCLGFGDRRGEHPAGRGPPPVVEPQLDSHAKSCSTGL